MASVPVTIVGTLTDKEGSQNVTLVGMAQITGLEVGGGPIMPGSPPGIWGGGNVPMPTPPIANVPGAPGYNPPGIDIPPGIWPNPPEGIAPHPEHPIVIPPPPGLGDGVPPVEVQVIWTPENGWQVVLAPTGDHVAPSGGRRR